MLLAGDIGGTKTNLAVYRPEGPSDAPVAEKTFPSTRYANLESIVREFLSEVDLPVDKAAFGVSGPVVAGRASVTNLPWEVDEEQLRQTLNLSSVQLLNDLEAIAQAIPSLKERDVHVLNEGQSVTGGAIALVAPGTGLGEAFLTWDGLRYRAHPSEGGHTDFAPTSLLEIELLRFLTDWCRVKRISYERVCSGIGLPNIYAFFRSRSKRKEPKWLADEFAAAKDPTPVIVDAALGEGKTCNVCVDTLDTFVSILGAEAGNLALKVLATGGVYLGGGIPPRIVSALEKGRFMEAFAHKGRMSDLMATMPVCIILNPKSALLGAACRVLEL
jgi:glucokinase